MFLALWPTFALKSAEWNVQTIPAQLEERKSYCKTNMPPMSLINKVTAHLEITENLEKSRGTGKNGSAGKVRESRALETSHISVKFSFVALYAAGDVFDEKQ